MSDTVCATCKMDTVPELCCESCGDSLCEHCTLVVGGDWRYEEEAQGLCPHCANSTITEH